MKQPRGRVSSILASDFWSFRWSNSMEHRQSTLRSWPDARGRFGEFGGRFVPETLMHPVEELEQAYEAARGDPKFQAELDRLLKNFAGRPTPLFEARRLAERLGDARIYLKREDLLHTGAHKINNCLGQGLLAARMGKTRLIAETGAGQHGVATAAVAAFLGLECTVYMGEEDMARQAPNVYRMRLLGTEVVPVASGSKTLKDAINEAMRDWVTNVHNTHYLLGSVLGPHPYPKMVPEFHRVIGQEALEGARVLARTEGIVPALEPAHAVAEVLKRAPKMPRDAIVVINLSGRGDKDLGIFQSAGIL